jgi:hypothetical protein
MEMKTIGPFEGSAEALAQEAKAAADGMGSLSLAILYTPLGVAHGPILEALKGALSCPVVGTTVGGASFTERGHSSTGVVLGLLGDVEVERARVPLEEDGALERVAEALDAMSFQQGSHHALMVLANSFLLDGEAFVKVLRLHSPRTCQHFGAMGGDDWTFSGPLVFDDGQPHAKSALLIRLSNQKPWSGKAMHGFCPLPSARKHIVTAVDGMSIVSLSGRPAFEVYLEELQRAGIVPGQGDAMRQTLTTYELGMVSVFNPELRVRSPFGVDAATGALRMTTAVEVGIQVEVVHASREALVNAATTLRQDVVAQHEAHAVEPPGGLLVFDCAARFLLLGDAYGQQVAAFGGDKQTPMLGFASYGEVGRFRGQVEGFHNTTAVMVAAS